MTLVGLWEMRLHPLFINVAAIVAQNKNAPHEHNTSDFGQEWVVR